MVSENRATEEMKSPPQIGVGHDAEISGRQFGPTAPEVRVRLAARRSPVIRYWPTPFQGDFSTRCLRARGRRDCASLELRAVVPSCVATSRLNETACIYRKCPSSPEERTQSM